MVDTLHGVGVIACGGVKFGAASICEDEQRVQGESGECDRGLFVAVGGIVGYHWGGDRWMEVVAYYAG